MMTLRLAGDAPLRSDGDHVISTAAQRNRQISIASAAHALVSRWFGGGMTDTNAIDFYHGQVDDQRVRLERARSSAEIKIRLWLIAHYAAQIDVARRNGERATLPRIR